MTILKRPQLTSDKNPMRGYNTATIASTAYYRVGHYVIDFANVDKSKSTLDMSASY